MVKMVKRKEKGRGMKDGDGNGGEGRREIYHAEHCTAMEGTMEGTMTPEITTNHNQSVYCTVLK